MARPRVVTLTSDTGSVYAAQMKAALLRYVAPAQIVDIAHDLPAHRVQEAAFLLDHVGSRFPAGTVHLAVVDPGVGGSRAPIAIRCRDGSLLVGPDNGVLAPLAVRLGGPKAYRLDPARVVPGGTVSATFEGRDLFAPAAGRLARGVPVARLGRAVAFVRCSLPRATRSGGWIRGEILHEDRFGNLITNVPTGWLPQVPSTVRSRWGRRRLVLARQRTYSDLPPGTVGILGSSFGTLELCVREGSAARTLGLGVGGRVAFSSVRPRAGKTVNSVGRT
ncbi:MAG TPA: SAM-dependent chlorinase/fluorinase [Thermoplasmata archaeon]